VPRGCEGGDERERESHLALAQLLQANCSSHRRLEPRRRLGMIETPVRRCRFHRRGLQSCCSSRASSNAVSSVHQRASYRLLV
jgi:hypothetical protein